MLMGCTTIGRLPQLWLLWLLCNLFCCNQYIYLPVNQKKKKKDKFQVIIKYNIKNNASIYNKLKVYDTPTHYMVVSSAP